MDVFLRIIEKVHPDFLVNCVALVDLAACEKDTGLAESLNAGVARRLAQFCRQASIYFIHISTDQIFDGNKKGPYSEIDSPNPTHVYGRTKLMGERAVLSADPEALVVRTNILGFRDRPDQLTFAEWLCAALKEKRPITLAQDFVTSSVHVALLSEMIFLAWRKRLRGIYNFASADSASKYHLGQLLSTMLGLGFENIKKGRLEDLKLVPKRPANSSLDVSKAEKALGIFFPTISKTANQIAVDFKRRLKEETHAQTE